MQSYDWPGNIRQLKNITEHISVIEKKRDLNSDILQEYLPEYAGEKLPALYKPIDSKTFNSERDILYQILFDMKRDMNDLKKLVLQILEGSVDKIELSEENSHLIKKIFNDNQGYITKSKKEPKPKIHPEETEEIEDTQEFVEETLSLENTEMEVIKKALEKFHGKRKYAAKELGISERTLYRKLSDYNII